MQNSWRAVGFTVDSHAKKMPQIKDFLNESFVKDFFQQQSHRRALSLSGSKILKCEINPLKIGNSKAAIEFILQLDAGKKKDQSKYHQYNHHPLYKSFIGKWRRDGKGKEIFVHLQKIWHRGFNREGFDIKDGRLKIYEPIAYFPSHNLMLTSKASGIRLKDMFVQKLVEKEEIETHIMQAASWLAKLHSIRPLPGGVYYSMKAEEEKLNEWSEHLRHIYPDFAEKICNMACYILDKERSLDSKCFVLIHGDFHSGNIFVDGNDITVIDLEASCIFDPAKDLGYFIAKLLATKKRYQLALDIRLQERFLEIYTANIRSSSYKKGILERVDIYKARSYIQLLHSRYCRHIHFKDYTRYEKHKLDPIDFRYWIKRAEECLQ